MPAASTRTATSLSTNRAKDMIITSRPARKSIRPRSKSRCSVIWRSQMWPSSAFPMTNEARREGDRSQKAGGYRYSRRIDRLRPRADRSLQGAAISRFPQYVAAYADGQDPRTPLLGRPGSAGSLRRDPKKWKPVSRKDHAPGICQRPIKPRASAGPATGRPASRA
jgi:hypothetical protein